MLVHAPGIVIDAVGTFRTVLVSQSGITAPLLIIARGEAGKLLAYFPGEELLVSIFTPVPVDEILHLQESGPCVAVDTRIGGKPYNLGRGYLLLSLLLPMTGDGAPRLLILELYGCSGDGISPLLEAGKVAEPVEKVALELNSGLVRARCWIIKVHKFKVFGSTPVRPEMWAENGEEDEVAVELDVRYRLFINTFLGVAAGTSAVVNDVELVFYRVVAVVCILALGLWSL